MSKIKPIEWTSPSPMEAVDNSREDGECSSDGDSEVDELIDVDYNILPRPPPVAFTETPAAAQSMDDLQTHIEPAINLEYYSDDDHDGHDSSSSDSDSDEPSFKRKSYCGDNSRSTYPNNLPFNNPNAQNIMHASSNNKMDAQQSSTTTTTGSTLPSITEETITSSLQGPSDLSVEQKMRNFQDKRSKNLNIWSEVLLEEQQQVALEKLESFDVNNTVVERGPETYAFKPVPIITRKRKRCDNEKKKKKKAKDEDSDISSAGLSDDDLEYIRGYVSSSSSGNNTPEHPGLSIDIKSKTKKRKFSEKQDYLPISEIQKIIHKLRGRKLCYYMADQLKEPKHQLIIRACEVLGKNYCMHMFIKTMKIEKKGGLLIKSQTRRRTPGGIFFYMIRNDKKYDQAKIDSIFEIDKQIAQRDKKARTAEKLRRRKEKLEALQKRQTRFHGTVSTENAQMETQGTDDKECKPADEEGELSSDYSEYFSDDSDLENSSDYIEESGESSKPKYVLNSSQVTMDDDDDDCLDVVVSTNDLDDI